MAQGYWVVRTYEAGNVGEKTKFWIPGDRPSRSHKKEKSEIYNNITKDEQAEMKNTEVMTL